MKRKFDRLRESLDEFVQQDDYPMLIVSVRSDEIAYVLKFLQGLEQTLPAHLIVAFPQPYLNPQQWLDELVDAVRLQLEVLATQRAERGERPCPPLPLAVADSRCPPVERLRALLEYLTLLLPNQDDYRVVVGLMPLECQDIDGFARLVATTTPHPDIPPYMNALRLIVWDDRDCALLRTGVFEWQAQHVLTYTEDFSTPALTDALSKDAADPEVPLAERMGAMQQLAALDFAYKRHDEALAKYALLHEYYFQHEQPAMQALCLLGAGDTLHAAGDSVMAKQRLQQGIATAMQSRSLPVLVNLLSSASTVSAALGQLDDAESYADSGAQVATATLNPFAHCDMLELRGDAQIAQRKLAEGMQSYDRCRELCRTYEYFDRWRAVLDKQVRIYEQAGMVREQRELEGEQATVQQLEAGAGGASA